MFDWDEYRRWMRQARHTLESIRADMEYGNYDWACFKAQQVAEYSLKALLRGVGEPAFGHDLRDLLERAKEYCELNLESEVARLSKFYIPTRYPDAFPGGSPYEFYTREEAEEALKIAEKVYWEVERCVHGIERGVEEEG